jgi:RNA polymerase sigma-70 factor, ECF subfamily
VNVPTGVSEMALAIEINLSGNTLTRNETSLNLLIERAAAGDTAAFEQIMIHSQQRVMALSWRMLGNEADARDATQEVFLRVYKYLARFKRDQDFFAWLYGITINVCRTSLKKSRHQTDRFTSIVGDENDEALDVATDEIDAEQSLIHAQRREIILKAIAGLPYKERASIVLREVEGYSTDEVARILKSSATTVRSQISSARRKIREHYRDFTEVRKSS